MRVLHSLGIPAVILLLGTIPFRVWPVDETIQSWAWSDEGGWLIGKLTPWKELYDFGTIPGILVALVSLVVFGLGWVSSRWLPWRKVSAYLVLCMIVGPGMIVNLGFKDHWGRPRPKDTIPYGGRYSMERVWTIDPSSPGKSFPCGHCTMGFYFLAAAMVLRRQGKRGMAPAVLAVGLVLGGLLGTARILQGGHFASDVFWGFGFCWLTALGLFHALRLDEDWVYRPSGIPLRAPGPVLAAGIAVGCALFVGFLLSTPYHAEERHRTFSVPAKASLALDVTLHGSHHRISASAGNAGEIRSSGQGHGLPGSKVKESWNQDFQDGTSRITFNQRIRGWFTELDHGNILQVPGSPRGSVRIRIPSGRADLDLSAASADQEWTVELGPHAQATWRAGDDSGGSLIPGAITTLRGQEPKSED